MDSNAPAQPTTTLSLLQWTLGFVLVGIAWGFTTPFIRRAALQHHPAPHPILQSSSLGRWQKKTLGLWFTVTGMLRNPSYAVPLLVNLTGSVWFFLLIGKAGEFVRWPAWKREFGMGVLVDG